MIIQIVRWYKTQENMTLDYKTIWPKTIVTWYKTQDNMTLDYKTIWH